MHSCIAMWGMQAFDIEGPVGASVVAAFDDCDMGLMGSHA
jgi:hypothetical protein